MLPALISPALETPALAMLGIVNVLVWAITASETAKYEDENRYRLRHGRDVELPGTAAGTEPD